MKLHVDEIMAQVSAEVARRRGAQGSVAGGSGDAGEITGNWPGALPALPAKQSYVLPDLLIYSDRVFVQNAYAAVLGRTPDFHGQQMYLRRLRIGEMTKIDVLGALRWSEEGRDRGVHIDGLLIPYVLQRWKRKRIVGPLVSWCHGLLRIGSIQSRLSLSEASQAHESTYLGDHVSRLAGWLEEQRATALQDMSSMIDRVAQLRSAVDHDHAQMEIAIADFVQQIDLLADKIAGLEDRTGADTSELQRHLDQLRSDMAGTTASLATFAADLETQSRRLDESAALLTGQEGRLAAHGAVLANEENMRKEAIGFQRSLDPFYVAFEQHFRGSPELIRERALPYIAILQDAQVGDRSKPVLDIGCGNGDWLHVLREHHLSAVGVDSNRMFAELCRARGLEVVEDDALSYLRGLPDGSLGAVTGMHIAEHLPFETLVMLLDECRRVLCVGGVLALETPNPENLLVGSHYFYLDPTHRNPLPPEALRWIVEARGFQMARIERWTVARDVSAPPLLPDDVPGAASVNTMLSHLRMAPDYAVIARRL